VVLLFMYNSRTHKPTRHQIMKHYSTEAKKITRMSLKRHKDFTGKRDGAVSVQFYLPRVKRIAKVSGDGFGPILV